MPTAIPNTPYHVPILMYHRVVTDERAAQVINNLLVRPDVFDAEMKLFADDGWTTITLGWLAAEMRNGIPVPPKTFVVTFDDGWWDGYEYAFPIMEKYGFVGTFFVVADRIGKSSTLSVEQMDEMIAAGNEIGDHALAHYDLAGHAYDVDYNQVCMASDAIEKAVGVRPVSFAYPMGGYDANAQKAVAACPGMQIAVTTNPGATETWGTRLVTARVRVNRSTGPAGLLSYAASLSGH